MKKYGNLEMLGNSINDFNIDPVSEWPTTAKQGRVINYNNRLYLCVSLSGAEGLPVWIPLTVGLGTFIHNQTIASSFWVVSHGLNQRNPMVQIYDDQNDIVIPDQIESIDDNTLVIHFSMNMVGRAVILSPTDASFTSPTSESNYGTSLPTTDLYNGRKFTVLDDGTYYYDTRLVRWVKATQNYNPYDIGFSVSGAVDVGEAICTFMCPRSLRVSKSFNGCTAYHSSLPTDAVLELHLDSALVAVITFTAVSGNKVGVWSSTLTNDLMVSAGQTIELRSVSGIVQDLNVVVSAELLGV